MHSLVPLCLFILGFPLPHLSVPWFAIPASSQNLEPTLNPGSLNSSLGTFGCVSLFSGHPDPLT